MHIGDLFEDRNSKRLIEQKAKLLKYRMYLREDNTPLRDVADYKAKLQALKQILADPDTARDPLLRKEVQRRLGQLHAEAENLGIMDQVSLAEDELNVGDPVTIVGDVQFSGKTGEVVGFDSNKSFVIVDLYNHGRHSFHSSNVEYNDYADSDDEESRMYDQNPDEFAGNGIDDNLGENVDASELEPGTKILTKHGRVPGIVQEVKYYEPWGQEAVTILTRAGARRRLPISAVELYDENALMEANEFADEFRKMLGQWADEQNKKGRSIKVTHGPAPQRPVSNVTPPADVAPNDEERSSLEARLKELTAKFDPNYDYSDDYSFWSQQSEIAKQIAAIKKRLATGGISEGDFKGRPVDQELVKRQGEYWDQVAKDRKKKEQEKARNLRGTPVVSLGDFGSKDDTKDRYGRTVPKKLKRDDPRVSYYKDEVDEGIVSAIKKGAKNVKRGLQGWDKRDIGPGGERLGDPKDIVRRNKSYDDKTVKQLAKNTDFGFPLGKDSEQGEHSPRGLQKRVLNREIKKRGIGEDEDKGSKYRMYPNQDDTWRVEDENGNVVVRRGSKGEAEHAVTAGNEKLKNVSETSDYFRRREREEGIISGKKPARKRAPAQTSDYAKRREQEKKQGVSEGLAKGQAAWKKEMQSKGAVSFKRDQHGGGSVDRIVAYDKDGKVVGGFNRKGISEGSETAADIDKMIEFHKQGQAAVQYKGPMNKKHAAKIRELEAKKAALKQGVAEGYILKKTNVDKYVEPGDPDEYRDDMKVKDTDYEIINNKTGQVVGVASWTTNDYFGPGALKITMKNGATRYLDIWDSEKGNPQSAFNRFVKDARTSKKYKAEGQMLDKAKTAVKKAAKWAVTPSANVRPKGISDEDWELYLKTHKPEWAKDKTGVVKEGPDSSPWRVEQSEATGRFHVVKGYYKTRKVWKNKMGAVDFNKREDAEAQAKKLNGDVDEGHDWSPPARESMKNDRIQSLKNLISSYKQKGNEMKVKELQAELRKVRSMTEASKQSKQEFEFDAEHISRNTAQEILAQLEQKRIEVDAAGMDPTFTNRFRLRIIGNAKQAKAVRDLIWEYNNGAYCGVTPDLRESVAVNEAAMDPADEQELNDSLMFFVKEMGGRAWLDGGSYAYLLDSKKPNQMYASDGSPIKVRNWAEGIARYADRWVVEELLSHSHDLSEFLKPAKKIGGQSDYERQRAAGDLAESNTDQVSKKKSKGIEAHGIRGMKSTPWRKTFKSQEAYEKWLDQNKDDVEVHATRDLEESKSLNKRVKIVKGPADAIGKIGNIGEIRTGLYKGAPKTYTVDYEDDHGQTRSIQLPGTSLRLVKGDEQVNEIFGFGKKPVKRDSPEERARKDKAWAAAKQNIDAQKQGNKTHWQNIDAAKPGYGKERAADHAWGQGIKEGGSVIGGGDPGDSTASPVGSIARKPRRSKQEQLEDKIQALTDRLGMARERRRNTGGGRIQSQAETKLHHKLGQLRQELYLLKQGQTPVAETDATKVNELSNEKLGKYKKAAGADARRLDKQGTKQGTEKANKRFHGIVQATKKEFDNDSKKELDEEIEWRLDEMKQEGYEINGKAD